MTLLLCVLLAQAAWSEKSPADAGLSREKLDALRDLAGGRGCVVRGGNLVYSWGDITKPGDVASAIGPVISTLLMIAVQEGKLSGVDARVSEVEPRLTGKNAGITWRQLASQTSGYGLAEEPGAAWSSNGYALALYIDTLIGRVYGKPVGEVLRTRLGSVLQFQDPYSVDAISPRDFARYGLMVLRGGKWGDTQVVTPGLAYLSISAPVAADTPASSGKDGPMIDGQRTLGGGKSGTPVGPGCSSFSWWVNGMDARRRQLFVDGPGDLVAALGDGGKRALWILPSRDLIVSWNDSVLSDLDRSPGNPEARINLAVRLMREACGP